MSTHRDSDSLGPAAWLLAETTRRIEESAGDWVLDDPATRAARALDAAPAARIVERARQRPGGPAIAAEIGTTMALMRVLLAALLVAGGIAGGAAAASIPVAPYRAGATGSGTIALSHALVVLLGIPLALLALWLLLSFVPGSTSGAGHGMVGRAFRGLWVAATRRLGMVEHRRYLAAAVADLGSRHGRSLLALATHGFWAAFHLGAIAWLWVQFIALRYDFTWETTLLATALGGGTGDSALAGLVTALGALPAWLPGVEAPSAEQVRMLIEDRSPPADRALWAGWLLAMLAVYGLLPRAALATGFALRWRRMRVRLDLSRPGYLRVLPALAGPPSQSLGPVGKPPPAPAAVEPLAAPDPGAGGAVVIGVELEPEDWPPALSRERNDVRLLGRADNRRQQREMLGALAYLEPPPARIIALCSALRTPDRGTGQWLRELAAIAPVELRLTGIDRLEAMAIDPRTRVDDWRTLARRFGLSGPAQSRPDQPGSHS